LDTVIPRDKRKPRERLQVLLPLAVFVLSLVLYIRTLAPTITWKHDGYDAGDLITAAYTLGIPHPTGYPAYMLLGKCITALPVGDIAYRMNLLSALAAALAASACCAACLTTLGRRRYATVAAVSAALLLATSRVFWSQAVITEVYALNALFFATVTYLTLHSLAHLVEWSDSSSGRKRLLRALSLVAFTFALSLGNHLTMLFAGPLLVFLCHTVARRRMLRLSDWACLGGLVSLGLSVYLYLPLRAGREPLLNWGDPENLRGFMWVVGGGIYRQFVFGLPSAYWLQRVAAWAGLVGSQFGLLPTALGLVGAWRHYGRDRQEFVALLITALLYSVYAISYNTTDSYVYLLPVFLILALWVAQGTQYVIDECAVRVARPSRLFAAAACAATLAVPLNSLHANLRAVDLHADRTAYDYGSQALAQAPDHSIIVSATDAHTFTLWYFVRIVSGRAQDVAVVDRDLLGYDWYVAGLRRLHRWLRVPETQLTVESMIQVNQPESTILWADADEETRSRYDLQLKGVLYR
jgi:hypothetical protein